MELYANFEENEHFIRKTHHVVKLDDVRVVEASEDADFAVESLKEFRVVDLPGKLDLFYRDLDVRVGFHVSAEDFRVRALTQHLAGYHVLIADHRRAGERLLEV